uniref:GRF-type domain-containing protein n=1 Tax=Aegilops tauschii subsp. strangulata TaxID=200361 RepID=A0A453LZZ7_AEGTS
GEVEEKACPCGAGICLVLTSSTPRNPGRKFYRCPTRDNGGCNFFEWCDAPSPGAANARSSTSFQSDASIVNMPCSCGAGTCLILTTKAGVNVGRQFYRCPAQVHSSGHFMPNLNFFLSLITWLCALYFTISTLCCGFFNIKLY